MTEEREAKAIWSMAYERLDPVALRRDHLQMARTRYHSL